MKFSFAKIVLLSATVAVLLCACEELFGLKRRPVTAQQITIDPAESFQTMKGFAASDCWTPNYVGKFWNESEKEQIARWLFSQEFDEDGNPEGIGLSMWRFNLGAGTEEQGEASGITGDYAMRRAECFLNNDTGAYDWDKAAGQQYFLRKAKEYGVESFVAFSNSPPLRFTRNGKGYAPEGNRANLQSDKYEDFAGYLAEVAKHFRESEDEIVFDYISPVNESAYPWTGKGQEGSPWTNPEIKNLVVELDKAIQARSLPTKILITEAPKWWYLYEASRQPNYDNQIDEFFKPGSNNYIGNLPSVPKLIGAHTYYTYKTDDLLTEYREKVKGKADEFGLEVFQTEYSMLDDAGEGIPSNSDDASYMDVALFMAKMIYADVAIAGCTSWSFWTALDVERWNHKNRFLLIALASGVKEFQKDTINSYPITQSGAVKDYPTLWAMGNYSLFVRPGFQRIAIEGVDDLKGLMATAYVSEDDSRIVAVYVNMGTDSVEMEADFSDGRSTAAISCYLTDETHNLSLDAPRGMSYLIPPRSIYTVVYDF